MNFAIFLFLTCFTVHAQANSTEEPKNSFPTLADGSVLLLKSDIEFPAGSDRFSLGDCNLELSAGRALDPNEKLAVKAGDKLELVRRFSVANFSAAGLLTRAEVWYLFQDQSLFSRILHLADRSPEFKVSCADPENQSMPASLEGMRRFLNYLGELIESKEPSRIEVSRKLIH